MSTSFNIGIDWRRKGLICWEARPGDALNRIPRPLQVDQFYRWVWDQTGSGGTSAVINERYETGVRLLRLSAPNAGAKLVLLVGEKDTANGEVQFPVTLQAAHRASVWVRGNSGYGSNLLYVEIRSDNTRNLLGQSTIALNGNWQRVDVAFTAGSAADDNRVFFEIFLPAHNANTSVDFTGFMIVEGTTAPGYNAGSTADLYDNVTAWTTDAEWFLGIHRPYQDDADDSMLRLRLKNADKTFSPEFSGSPLYGTLAPYRPVMVRSNDGTTLRTHWTGWIESLQPSPDQYGERMVEIRAAGPMLFLEDVETALEVQENKRTDVIIDTLLDEVEIPPALSQSWLLGVVGYGEMGSAAYLADTVLPHTLEAGKTTLAYAGDNWVRPRNPGESASESFNVYRAIKDVVAAERGRFFFDREGRAQFWNRHHLLLDTTVKATFDNTMVDVRYEYAGLGEFKNEVVVTCHPRTVSAGDTDLLWQLEQPLTVPPGETKTLNISYRDDSENRIGGKNVRVEAVTFSEGSAGVRLTAGGNRATLEIINNAAGGQKAVLATAEVRGTKITSFGQMEATAQELTSAAFYGRRVMRMNLASIDRLDDAQTIADFELGRRSQPSGKVSTIKVVSDAKQGGGQHAQQLARTIGDLITVKEAQTAHDERYFIIGEEHRLTQRGELLETTWFLEPAAEGQWWLLGTGKLNETSRTAY
ncbi:MAG: hypothetical protein SF029_05280 [bacterium]|nr:hypothetical protein [bacterium]